jgi:hypothetical protein
MGTTKGAQLLQAQNTSGASSNFLGPSLQAIDRKKHPSPSPPAKLKPFGDVQIFRECSELDFLPWELWGRSSFCVIFELCAPYFRKSTKHSLMLCLQTVRFGKRRREWKNHLANEKETTKLGNNSILKNLRKYENLQLY